VLVDFDFLGTLGASLGVCGFAFDFDRSFSKLAGAMAERQRFSPT